MKKTKRYNGLPPVLRLIRFSIAASAVSPVMIARADTASGHAIVAQGEGFEVCRSQLDEAWAIYSARIPNAHPAGASRRDIEAKLLDHIIETRILTGRASAEEKARASEEADTILANSRKRFATDEEFIRWLESSGMTPETYRRRVVDQRVSEAVIDRELQPSEKVGDEDVKKYYDENRDAFIQAEQARGLQIFFSIVDPATGRPLSDDRIKAKEQLAAQIKARLDRGEIFFKLYREFSEDPGAREREEGDEVLFSKGQMGPEFDAAAFAPPTGSGGGVVASKQGFHIIRISARQPARSLEFTEVAPRLRNFLTEREIKKQLPAYLEKIKKQAGATVSAGLWEKTVADVSNPR